MKRSAHASGRAATLMETLCVVALLGMATAVVAQSLGAMRQDLSAPDSTRRAIASADSLARLRAMRSDPTELWATGTMLAVGSRSSGQIIASRRIGVVSLEIARGTSFVDGVRYDGSGRTTDFAVAVRREGVVHRYLVCGATGWTEYLPASESPP